MRLPRILSTCLLLAGALAWLTGPGAPAEPRSASSLAAAPAQPWGAEEIWLEGPTQEDLDVPQPRRAAAAPSKPNRAPRPARHEPSEALPFSTPAAPPEQVLERPGPALETPKPAIETPEAALEPAEPMLGAFEPAPEAPAPPFEETPDPVLDEEPVREPAAPPAGDDTLDLVRRMLAIHARMAEP